MNPHFSYLRLSPSAYDGPGSLWDARPPQTVTVTEDHQVDGLTLVAASAGVAQLMPATFLDDTELTSFRSELEEYVNDPGEVWVHLLADLAYRRLPDISRQARKWAAEAVQASAQLTSANVPPGQIEVASLLDAYSKEAAQLLTSALRLSELAEQVAAPGGAQPA